LRIGTHDGAFRHGPSQRAITMDTSPELELIRALAEDLALEILASYAPEDFADADFTSLGKAAVFLAEHGSAPGPALEELIIKVQKAAGTALEQG
jgi:hypothetical protein